jgi:hypothetical protein
MTVANTDEDNDLGEHNGLPILGQSIVIKKTGNGLEDSVDIAPHVFQTDGYEDCLMRIRQRKTSYANVYSKEDGLLLGIHQIEEFDAVIVMIDDRKDTGTRLDKMVGKVADKRERDTQEAKGQFRLVGVDPVGEEDDPERRRW